MDNNAATPNVAEAVRAPAIVSGRDELSRSAIRQMLWLGVVAVGVFVGLMAALSWAASLTGAGATSASAIDFENNSITTSIRFEPPQLDSSRSSDTVSNMLLNHVMEGLVSYDEQNNLVPGVAERWEVRADGATFWLREDALWSDGRPVTADDFVFAWRTAVDPKTTSRYAFILYGIKNGEAINQGKMSRETLGVRAAGDRVLEVEFENPIAFFDKLVAYSTFMPIREDFFLSRNGRYAADAEDLLFNGPFRLTQWVHGASLRLEKNPTYWDSDSVKLDAVDFAYITTDAVARLNLYQDGRIVDVDFIPGEAIDQILQQRWPVGRYADGSVWFLQLNHRPDRITNNYNFRRALQLANDPGELVYKVLKDPGYTVADSIFPSWLKGERELLRQEYPPPQVQTDLAAAREHLELARQELGLEKFPPLVLLSDDTPAATTQGEYLQEYLKRTLGLDVRIDRQIFKQRLAKAEDGDFDIVIYGWGPDFDDPLTFGDMFGSWNLNNHGRYNNPALDAQIRIAQQSNDQGERMAAFGEIQRIMVEDAVIIMAYERGVTYVQDARVKNVTRRAVGAFVDYTHAYIVENP